MEKYNIAILPVTSMGIYKQLVCSKGWQWLYIGTNAGRREKILKEFGASKRFHYAKELQKISLKHKKTFLDWIADMGMKQNSKYWWASNIAYKSPFASDFFLNYCFLLLIRKWIADDVKKRVIIVENPWMVMACLNNFQGQSVYIDKNLKDYYKNLVTCHIVSYARIFLFLSRSLLMWIVNKVYAFNNRKHLAEILGNKIDILNCTWIEERSFKGKENRFYNQYLGNLQEYCIKKELKSITVTMPVFPLRLLRKAYQSKEIIPSIYFAKLTDIFEIYFKILIFNWSVKVADNSIMDLKYLIKYEKIKEKGEIGYAFLQYRIFFNIFEQQRIPCRTLIYPFENQPWDKMMILGVREVKSKCKIIACHGIGIPCFYLNFYLGENEGNIHPQPDIIVSNGKYWETVLKNAGFTCTIKNGGSIRFSQQGKSCKGEIHSKNRDFDNNVLVLLSTSLQYSLDLVFYLLRTSNNQKKYFIKTHPDTPEKIIRKYTGVLPGNYTFVGGSLEEWMMKVGWAIHIGTTAAIECMMHGITVFKYLPERIDLDPLLGLNITQNVVADNDLLNFTKEEISDLPDNNLIAEPFNKETWTEILTN